MTTEKRTTIDPEDLIGIELECARCHVLLSVPALKVDRLSNACPNCREEWFTRGGPQEAALGDFIESFKHLRQLHLNAKLRFRVKGIDDAAV